MRLRQALALLLATVFALLPVSAALAEGDYQEGDGWVYENGVFTITENGGWEQATEFGLPRNYAPNRKGFESLDNIQTVIIGKEVTEPFGLYGYYISWYDSPETVRIEEGNTCFAIENGWVVNTWTHTLICAEHPRESRETAVVIDNLPEDIRSIGACAFWDYEKLEEIVIPEKVTVIEFCAFAGCISLTHMVLPENLHTIGESAFADAALETCNWPSKLEILELGAFGHTNLTTVDLSNTRIRSVPGWCFSACEELEWIKLPEALVIIDGSAFLYCRGLKTVVIDASGVIVEGDAFEHCNGLTNMVFLRERPYLLGINEFRIDGPQHWLGDSGETPTPAFYYTEAYQEDWAPNGETQWYEYDIRPVTQEGIEALLTMEPAEATDAPTASPEPVETPTPTPDATAAPTPTAKPAVEPTATPAAEQAGRGTGAWVMVLLAAVGVLAVTVTILGIRLYGKGRK